MSIKLGQNIQSIGAQRQLDISSQKLASIYERLASGQRINKSSDDAAGLAIADSLNAKTRIYTQALRNASDGQSALSIADSAYGALSDITIRLRELSEQSATGTFSATQRESLDNEAQALKDEFERITATTSFNGISLLDGSLAEGMRLQVGIGVEGSILVDFGGSTSLAGEAVGTGTFGSSTSYANEGTSFAVTLGDLNGDSIFDLVSVGGVGTGHATIRLGMGDGTFGTATTYETEVGVARAVILGDLDGDNILDLVSTGEDAGGVATIRLGVGDGTFGVATSYVTQTSTSRAVALADFDGDSILDLITTGLSGGSNYSTVRIGAGDGTFGAATSYSLGGHSVAVGDVNDDDIIDFVTTTVFGGPGSTIVRLGVGDGTFGVATSYTMGGFSATLGDVDGDSNLDIVLTNSYSSSVLVRIGAGDGTFSLATSYNIASPAYSVALRDLNGDQNLDIIAAGYGGGLGIVSVKLGIGDGTFGATASYFAGGTYARSPAIGDVDGDGAVDLVTTSDNGVAIRLANTVESSNEGGSAAIQLQTFSLRTRAGALSAMDMLDETLSALSSQRGVLGAYQSRLTIAANTLLAQTEQFRSAESRIRDADMAQEAAELSRVQILQQAGASVLAQANQAPALALTLLRT